MNSYHLYTYFRSTTAWRVNITLNLKKIRPTIVPVNILKDEHKNPYHKRMNPNGNVPVLTLPDGSALLQSMAIIEYLNEVHPEPFNLFPGDAKSRAMIRSFCEVINTGIQPYKNIKMNQKLRQGSVNAEWNRKFSNKKLQTLQLLVNSIGKSGKYVLGDEITAADIFFYPQVLAAKSKWQISLEPHPSLNKILTNLEMIPQFKETNKDYEPQQQIANQQLYE